MKALNTLIISSGLLLGSSSVFAQGAMMMAKPTAKPMETIRLGEARDTLMARHGGRIDSTTFDGAMSRARVDGKSIEEFMQSEAASGKLTEASLARAEDALIREIFPDVSTRLAYEKELLTAEVTQGVIKTSEIMSQGEQVRVNMQMLESCGLRGSTQNGAASYIMQSAQGASLNAQVAATRLGIEAMLILGRENGGRLASHVAMALEANPAKDAMEVIDQIVRQEVADSDQQFAILDGVHESLHTAGKLSIRAKEGYNIFLSSGLLAAKAGAGREAVREASLNALKERIDPEDMEAFRENRCDLTGI